MPAFGPINVVHDEVLADASEQAGVAHGRADAARADDGDLHGSRMRADRTVSSATSRSDVALTVSAEGFERRRSGGDIA